ncbi:OCIA domain-containing protein 1 [Uranotaenia lowii]|uniref:OCIA domain-containing protein 1 n=1 Tax=Uranotaenia lowii TaxID=190385 RepID=UPI00247B29F9|nr:OCIA domain-containing protein 1 [Uranotaenia lowii]
MDRPGPMAPAQNPYQDPQQNVMNYQFSPEELKVLQECNREAFFQRSLPLGTAAGLGVWYAVKQGHLKGNVRFGAAPKVILGVTLGYFLGKVSYQTKCAEKLMRLPNSRLAEMLRQRRLGASGGAEKLLPDQGFGTGSMLSPFGPTSPSDTYTDEHFRGIRGDSFNIDVNTPTYSGLDDSGRPTVDSFQNLEEDLQLPPTPPAVTKSYEELRRQNREDYAKRQQGSAYRPPTPPAAPAQPSQQPDDRYLQVPGEKDRRPAAEEPTRPQSKNKYGDSWS